MDLIVLAVAVLVLLTVVDAHLWPQAMPQRWAGARGRYTPKRIVPRRRGGRPTPRMNRLLGFAAGRRRESTGPLWWWE
jgi:hypothetical protein